MSPVWCSTSFEDIEHTQGPSSKLLQFLCLNFRVLPVLKTLNTQGPLPKFIQFLCLQFGVLPLLKTLTTQGPLPKFIQFLCLQYSTPMSPVWCSTSFEDIEHTGSIITNCFHFLCLNFRVLPLLKTFTTQGPLPKIHSIPMSPVWCSTSFADIDYTGSIAQIHSIPMSTSFEDIEYTGSITQIHSSLVFYLC